MVGQIFLCKIIKINNINLGVIYNINYFGWSISSSSFLTAKANLVSNSNHDKRITVHISI